MLLPTLLVARAGRTRAFVGFAGTAVVVVAGSLALAGGGRTLSPLTWQRDRGLQVESLMATPFLLAQQLGTGPRHWTVAHTRFNTFEISGPGVPAALTAATVLGVCGLAVLVVLWVRAARVGRAGPAALGWLSVAGTLIVIITNKALSPQYLLWVAGPLAALLLVRGSRPARTAGLLVVLAAALTHVYYPWTYIAMSKLQRPDGIVAVLAVAVRNLILCWLTACACLQALRADRSGAHRPAAGVRVSGRGRSAASAT